MAKLFRFFRKCYSFCLHFSLNFSLFFRNHFARFTTPFVLMSTENALKKLYGKVCSIAVCSGVGTHLIYSWWWWWWHGVVVVVIALVFIISSSAISIFLCAVFALHNCPIHFVSCSCYNCCSCCWGCSLKLYNLLFNLCFENYIIIIVLIALSASTIYRWNE